MTGTLRIFNLRKKWILALLFLFLFGFFSSFTFIRGLKFSTYRKITKSTTVTSIPQILVIQKLGLKVNVESVGEAEDGTMGIPVNDNNAGWWDKGAKLGEKGSVVIDGHVDLKNGGPGVFYRLSQLNKGDEIRIEDNIGNIHTYRVSDTEIYNDSEFPIDLVFSRNDRERLNLITCAGIFDRKNKNYSKRLVVFAEK